MTYDFKTKVVAIVATSSSLGDAALHFVQNRTKLVTGVRRLAGLQSVLSAVALAGVLAAAHPSFADHRVTAADHKQAAAAAAGQPAPPAPVRPSEGTTAPAPSRDRGTDIPVGFGWG
jgi:hypothetical protein